MALAMAAISSTPGGGDLGQLRLFVGPKKRQKKTTWKLVKYTPPKTNIENENSPLEKEIPIGNWEPSFFRVHVSLGGCNLCGYFAPTFFAGEEVFQSH